jgi:predicted RNase H-like nuclease (RuvC/YqgF family)
MGLTELVGTVLLSGTGGAVIKSGVESLLNRRRLGADVEKVDADAADVVTRTALSLVEPLGRRIKELETEVDGLRAQVRQAHAELRQASSELEACRSSERAKDRAIRVKDQTIIQLGGTP